MVNYVARHEDITGANLSGTSGTSNRTYGLSYVNSVVPLFTLKVQGAILQYTDDFTLVAGLITFLNPVWDDQSIDIDYLTTTTSVSSGNLRYATVEQLAAILNMKSDIPSWEVGSSPVYETIGTGDNTTSVFYLDHKNIISNSYVLYKAVVTAPLTETTHYILNLGIGKITLTAAGITFLGTSALLGEYSYLNSNLSDEYLQEVLLRSETELDNFTNTTFTDGTAANPDYPVIVNEYQSSKGLFNRFYFSWKKPIIDITASLTADINSVATSLSISAGCGVKFPTSGVLVIGSEIISYSSISTDTFNGLTRGAYSSTASSHSSGDSIYTTSVQISGTDEGGVPSWYTLTRGSEVSVDEDGKIYIFKDTLYNSLATGNNLLNKQDVPDRFRINYLYGWDVIPKDVTRLTLLIAQRMLIADTMASSLIKGRNEFKPGLLDHLQREINLLIDVYKNIDIGNT
jgi:hypothetical protein